MFALRRRWAVLETKTTYGPKRAIAFAEIARKSLKSEQNSFKNTQIRPKMSALGSRNPLEHCRWVGSLNNNLFVRDQR